MPPTALALALTAAVMHAAWNYLVKTGTDRLILAWAIVASGAIVFAPVLVIERGIPGVAWVFAAASGTIHGLYGYSLSRAYDEADFSVAYPLARGLAPLLTALGGVLFLGERIGIIALSGLLVMSAALLVLVSGGGPLRTRSWAAITGVVIAVYTTVDAGGVREAGSALPYTTAVFVVSSIVLTPVVLSMRSPLDVRRAVVEQPLRIVAAGVLSVGAYGLVLAAALLAPIGLVAAVRETSVVIGATAGALLLREGFGPRRVAAATAMVAGIGLLGLA